MDLNLTFVELVSRMCVSLLALGNIFFIKRLVAKLEAIEQNVIRNSNEIGILKYAVQEKFKTRIGDQNGK